LRRIPPCSGLDLWRIIVKLAKKWLLEMITGLVILAAASPMHNYYPLVARAVSRLETNAPVARDVLFEKLRVILIDQLRIRQPLASSSEIMRERAALEVAIRKVESEAPIPSKSRMGLGTAETPGSKPIFSADPVRASGQRAEPNDAQREPKTISEGQHRNLESTTAAGHLASHQSLAVAKQQVELDALIRPKSRLGSAQAPGSKPISSSHPVRVPGQRAEANGPPCEPKTISEGQHSNLESTATAGHLASHQGFVAAEQRAQGFHGLLERPEVAVIERALVTLAHQLRSRQQPVARSEIKPGTVAIENAKRQVQSESVIPAVMPTELAGQPRATCRDDSNLGLSTAVNDLQREPINLRENDNLSNKSAETGSAKILDSLIGIQLLDRLMLDAAHPLAPDNLVRDARTVLEWFGIEKPEAIKTKHYDQFGRAIQRYMLEGRGPDGPAAATVQAHHPVLTDEIRGIFNRLLDREQSAMILDNSLTWFAKVWVRLIIALNFILIIGLVITAPTILSGVVNLLAIYSPLNVWSWIAEVVALSPAFAAIAWRDRRLKGPWGVSLPTLERPMLGRLTRLKRTPAVT
jgi:hypothetical protein